MLSKAAQECQELALRTRSAIQLNKWNEADEAFSELQERSTGWLKAQALQKNVSLQEAEDLVAETHLELFNLLSGTDLFSNVNAWMRTVLRNNIVDLFRLGRTTGEINETPEFWEEHSNTPGEADGISGGDTAQTVIERHETKCVNELLDALEQADPILRHVIEAQYWGNKSIEETATETGLTVDQVKKRRGSALKKLRQIAEKRGFTDDL